MMEDKDIEKILAVSWITEYCRKTIHYAVSMAVKYDADLWVIHVIDNWFHGMNFPMMTVEEERKNLLEKTRKELDSIVYDESRRGLKVKGIIVKEGDPAEEILKLIQEENIDLVMMRAQEQGRLENFLVGGSNMEIIRKMPCSVFLVSQESEQEDSLHHHEDEK